MKKTILESLFGAFGIEKTERFFQEFQEMREAMQRIAHNELNPYEGSTGDRLAYGATKIWCNNNLPIFNKRKKEIKILTPDARWCYVPLLLHKTMNFTKNREKVYSQFYVKPYKN